MAAILAERENNCKIAGQCGDAQGQPEASAITSRWQASGLATSYFETLLRYNTTMSTINATDDNFDELLTRPGAVFVMFYWPSLPVYRRQRQAQIGCGFIRGQAKLR